MAAARQAAGTLRFSFIVRIIFILMSWRIVEGDDERTTLARSDCCSGWSCARNQTSSFDVMKGRKRGERRCFG
jgi:hypothetical protein